MIFGIVDQLDGERHLRGGQSASCCLLATIRTVIDPRGAEGKYSPDGNVVEVEANTVWIALQSVPTSR